jgi:hypothetical protein
MKHQTGNQYIVAFLTVCFLSFPVFAQLSSDGVKGSFYVSVDDAAWIYVNGKKVFQAGIGESQSTELILHTGDRVVVHIEDYGGGRRFMLVFATANQVTDLSDQPTVVSFKHHDFKVLPDPMATDFNLEDFQNWTKHAIVDISQTQNRHYLAIKNYSEWIWGDLSKTTIGCIVTDGMIQPMPQ